MAGDGWLVTGGEWLRVSSMGQSFWRDGRFWRVAFQVFFLGAIALVTGLIVINFRRNLQQIGLPFGFDFLQAPAPFDIGETLIAYRPGDSYVHALGVGVLNSLRVLGLGIVLATGMGVTVGLGRLSSNWLVRQLATVYVEILRNTPLLLQLLFWYGAFFLQLPGDESAIALWGKLFLSQRGMRWGEQILLSPEFGALLLGLTLYTAAFIAEVVRGGVQAVPKGQWEAAQALGLGPGLTLRLIIFPQALRIIIPPLTSQYLNLAKNSSLAIAVGYPDLYAVASTTYNNTGRALEVMVLLMVTYLLINLVISLLLNLYNRAVKLQER